MRTSSERAYSELKRRIVTGEIPPGSRLVEVHLAVELGVSRTPVREALKRLGAEGFASRDGLGGLVVHLPTPQEIDEIYLVREVLDGLAARLAAHRISPDELSSLELTMEKMRSAVRSGEEDELVGANFMFHDLIYDIAGSRRLVTIAQSLRDFVRRYSTEAFTSTERATAVIEEHERIVEALEAHDPEGAEGAAREHLRNARIHMSELRLARAVAELSGNAATSRASAIVE